MAPGDGFTENVGVKSALPYVLLNVVAENAIGSTSAEFKVQVIII